MTDDLDEFKEKSYVEQLDELDEILDRANADVIADDQYRERDG